MWLLTTRGMFSVVTPRTEGGHGAQLELDKLMIRARDREHLERLRRDFSALAGTTIITTPMADYPYRMIVSKPVWAEVVEQLVLEQDYGNFKTAVAKDPAHQASGYVAALHEVWGVLRRLDDRRPTR